MTDSDYVRIAEAVRLLAPLGVSRRTLQRFAAAGQLGAIRVGRDYRIPRAMVDRILSEGLERVVG